MRFAPDTSWLLAWRSPIPTLGFGLLPPAGPSAPGFAAGPGIVPGEAGLTIHTMPASWGDGPVQGDGLGVITGYGSSIAGVSMDHAPSLPIERTVGGLAEGVPVPVLVWAYGHDGRIGAVASIAVYPAVTPPVSTTGLVEAVTGYGLFDAVTGRGLVAGAPA